MTWECLKGKGVRNISGLKRGDIVVATGVPGRFRNILNGTMWKVTDVRTWDGESITVGDANHPGIKTSAKYFVALDNFSKDQIRNTAGYGNGTDLSVRLAALEAFKPELKNSRPANGQVRIKVNGTRVYFGKSVAQALVAKNSHKLVQRKLIEKLRGF